MATTSIKSCRVAVEPTYGNLTDGVPAATALTFYAAIVNDMAQVLQVGAPVMTDVSTRARNCVGAVPREPNSLKDGSGDWIERRSGTFSLSMQLNGIGDGTGFTDWNQIPWYNLLRTILGESAITVPAADVVAAGTPTVNSHDATGAAGAYLVGQIIKLVKNGRSDYAGVTDIDTLDITYSPAMVTAASVGDTIYPMRELYYGCQPPTAAPVGTPDTISCAVELAGIGFKAIAYGTTIDGYTIDYVAETGRADITFSCHSPFITWTKATYVPVTPLCPAGGVLHHLNTYLKVSDTGGTACSLVAAPAALAATDYCLDSLSFSVTATRREIRCGSNIMAMAGREIDDLTVEGSVTLSSSTDNFDGLIWDQETRSIMIGMNSGDQTDPGEGAAFYVPAAVFTGDPAMFDSGSGGYRTMLAFSTSAWAGDSGTLAPANSQLVMAFGEDFTP